MIDKLNIFDIEYKVVYKDKASEVDPSGQNSLWGYIDFWSRTITIYDNDRSFDDILHTITHEVLHGIVAHLHIQEIGNLEEDVQEKVIDNLATGVCDFFIRNNLLRGDCCVKKIQDKKN